MAASISGTTPTITTPARIGLLSIINTLTAAVTHCSSINAGLAFIASLGFSLVVHYRASECYLSAWLLLLSSSLLVMAAGDVADDTS